MPTYRFQIDDGANDQPAELCELPDERAARDHATELADRLIVQQRPRFAQGQAWRMTVTDDTDTLCLQLDFTGVAAPRIGSHSYAAFPEEIIGRKLRS